MDTYENKPIYRGIDLFKFISAILILLLHIPPVYEGGYFYIFIRQILTVIAVPFFFAASGFLAVKKLSATLKGGAYSAIKRPYLLYIKWSLIYLPLALLSLRNLSISGIIFTYIRNFLLEGSYLTIWYLNALAFAFLFYFLLLKKVSALQCVYISVPLYIVGCLLSSYNQLFVSFPIGQALSDGYYTVFETTKNGLFFGLPFVAIGGFIATEDKQNNHKGRTLSGLVLFGVLIVAEVILRNIFFPNAKSVDFVLFLLPFTAYLLKIAARLDLNEKSVTLCGEKTDLYIILRHLSVLIFLTQRIFIFVIDRVVKIMNGYTATSWLSDFPILKFISVFILTLLFSLLLMVLSRKFKWIRKLY